MWFGTTIGFLFVAEQSTCKNTSTAVRGGHLASLSVVIRLKDVSLHIFQVLFNSPPPDMIIHVKVHRDTFSSYPFMLTIPPMVPYVTAYSSSPVAFALHGVAGMVNSYYCCRCKVQGCKGYVFPDRNSGFLPPFLHCRSPFSQPEKLRSLLTFYWHSMHIPLHCRTVLGVS